jgi:ankyrin repeat protein
MNASIDEGDRRWRSTRKWLFETPVAPAWRRRLEIGLGVVLSAATVVAFSSTIRPDPARLAALHPTRAVVTPLPETVDMTDSMTPTLSFAMSAAAAAGDVAAMRRAYRIGMPLEGTLRLAAKSGHKDAVAWLLGRGADVHEQENTMYSPTIAGDAFPEIAALLHSRGAAEPSVFTAAVSAAPNAIMRAIAAHPEQVKEPGALAAAARASWGKTIDKHALLTKMLDAGADPNDVYGSTSVLDEAIVTCDAYDCMPFVRLFLDRGAHVTGEVLGSALSLDGSRRPAVLDALLARPLDKGVTSKALARATSVNDDDLKRILALGVDWAWHDGEEDEARPLLEAVRRNDRDYARSLIDAGAPVDVHFKDASCALAVAIDGSSGDEGARVVELLVERGANVNRRFPDGRTPLYAAGESGNMRIVNFLLAHGARVNERTLDETALDGAEQHGNIPAARILAAHGGQRTRTTVY